jgi:hypothetical protein
MVVMHRSAASFCALHLEWNMIQAWSFPLQQGGIQHQLWIEISGTAINVGQTFNHAFPLSAVMVSSAV